MFTVVPAKAQPTRYEQGLALSLNNLSNALADVGDKKGSLKAIRESVDIKRRLAAAQPTRYEPDLATGLNNMLLRLGLRVTSRSDENWP